MVIIYYTVCNPQSMKYNSFFNVLTHCQRTRWTCVCVLIVLLLMSMSISMISIVVLMHYVCIFVYVTSGCRNRNSVDGGSSITFVWSNFPFSSLCAFWNSNVYTIRFIYFLENTHTHTYIHVSYMAFLCVSVYVWKKYNCVRFFTNWMWIVKFWWFY